MTFFEHWKQAHPGCDWSIYDDHPVGSCPSDFGYEEHYDCVGVRCRDCWAREVPGTENIKKEKKNMATKTKKELMEELKEARENIENLKKEIEKCERYKQYEACADEFAALRESFVNAGFSKDEAFVMMRDILQAQIVRAFG